MFIHLHNHSHYSLLDGLPKIKDYVNKCLEYKMPAMALTDHGSVYGVIEFYQKAKEAGIKPILGMEAYIAPRRLIYKKVKMDDKPSHLVLLAKNNIGYKNLIQLATIGHLDGFYYKPRLDKEVLKKYSEGLIATSACWAGEVSKALRQDNIELAKQLTDEYKNIFGKDNFYLESVYLGENIKGQGDLHEKLVDLSKKTQTPLMLTKDSHYINLEDADAQDALLCINTGTVLNNPKRLSMKEFDCSFTHPKLMEERFKDLPDAIENTQKIANECNVNLDLGKWVFPAIEIPKGKTADGVLRENTEEELEKRFPNNKEYKERIDYELDIIKTKGYSSYFLVVADLINWARSQGIVVTTRGSAAGSLVSYMTGIIDINPMFFKLPFERFLNPLRPSPPDVDMDFADNRREEVINYAKEKYGDDKVAQICTFGTMMARGAVRDVNRVLDFPYDMGDKLAKMIPMGSQGFPMTIEKALEMNPELKQEYDSDPSAKQVIDLAQKIEGCARHSSVHAAGTLISPTKMTDYVPLQRDPSKRKKITQFDMHASEAAGLLKFDFLGIANLSIIGEAVNLIKKTKDVQIVLDDIPFDDKKTFELLAKGQTIGLFQLSSGGMTKHLVELKPTNIFDIAAMVALYRPGPMEFIPEYIDRKHHPEKIDYPDDSLKETLEQSLGLLIYQEDVMLTAIKLAGYTWLDADKFRKAMGKKKPEVMKAEEGKFKEGCVKNGIDKQVAEDLWERIKPFASYAFNKCLTGDTEIIDTKTGEIKTIEDIYTKKDKLNLLSLNLGENKLESKKASRIHSNGRKMVWEIKTRTGKKIKATANHPFLKFNEWTNLENLKIRDRIATTRKITYESKYKIENFKLATLGYLLAEGNLCHPHGIYFYSSQKDELQDYIKNLEKFKNIKAIVNPRQNATSVYSTQKNRKKKNPLMKWVQELGLHNKKATEKFFPDLIFKLNKNQLSLLLGKMWQGDGCVHPDKNGQIFYATSSEKLAKQLQHLLLRLEIISTIHKKQFKYRDSYRIGYTINISRFTNVKNFEKTIGKHLIGKKKKQLSQLVKNNKILNGQINTNSARGSKDIIPTEILPVLKQEIYKNGLSIKKFARENHISERTFFKEKNKKGYLRETIQLIGEKLDSKTLLNHAKSDIYWDEVVDIKKIGIKQTYDLTIPNNHNFIANDFVVHNSHAASYGVVAYKTAYLKANFPAEYMTALMSVESGDEEKISAAVQECGKMEIKVLPPDINESRKDFTYINDNEIRFGLLTIKNLGHNIIVSIINERKENGPYKSLADLLNRVKSKNLNKKSLDALAKAGALDNFAERNLIVENIDNILGYIKTVRREKNDNQASLFSLMNQDDSGEEQILPLNLKPTPPIDLSTKLAWEKELLGLYVSDHPFSEHAKKINEHIKPIKEIKETLADEAKTLVGGVVTVIRSIFTKKNEPMMFVTIEDLTTSIEIVVFPRTLQSTREIWQEGNLVITVGKVSYRNDEINILADTAYVFKNEDFEEILTQANKKLTTNNYYKKSNGYGGNNNFNSTPKPVETVRITQVWINLPRFFNSEIHNKIKDVLLTETGEQKVFIAIKQNGSLRKIETNYKIRYNEDIKNKLEKITGEGSIVAK
jgi:DNA polymerase III subunit alpha